MQSVKINKEKITDKGKDNMNTIQWGEPRPLRQSADAIPFPLGALPPVLRDMAQAISVTTSTDVGMAGTAMLSAVGYCFTGLYRLAGKADHTEPPVLYSIIIAQPSERKSPVMHFIKAPFDTFESKYNKDHKEEFYKAQQDIKALELNFSDILTCRDMDFIPYLRRFLALNCISVLSFILTFWNV